VRGNGECGGSGCPCTHTTIRTKKGEGERLLKTTQALVQAQAQTQAQAQAQAQAKAQAQ
jgi:hypothetical protein